LSAAGWRNDYKAPFRGFGLSVFRNVFAFDWHKPRPARTYLVIKREYVIQAASSGFGVTKTPRKSMTFSLLSIFKRNKQQEGVRRINIYLLRLVFLLMFFVLGKTTWTHILTHKGSWDPTSAIAWCVWTAFATLAGLGIVRPLKMLPILLLEIFYKVLWLLIVALPLWSKGILTGSPAEATTSAFLWVILPVVAVPWWYVFKTFIYNPQKLVESGT
jgi:hypothetical protein